MLRSLEIRDIVLIERLDLELAPGLNVLTGETGAGKSILLDALGLAIGQGGRGDMVRSGAEQGVVTAVFDCPDGHSVQDTLRDAGFEPADGELILRRRLAAGGRSSAFVNDQRASTEVLRALGDAVLEVHGQHDDRGLLNPRGHRALLDAFAGAAGHLAIVRRTWADAVRADRALQEARDAIEEAARDAEWLRHAVGELRDLAPEPGEEAALDAERRLMQAAERIREDVVRAGEAIGPSGAEGRMTDAVRWLEDAAEAAEGRLDRPVAALDRAIAELGEAQDGVDAALDALQSDPARLEASEERLFALRALARKHRVQPDDLAALAAELSDRLDAVEGAGATLEALEAEARTARDAFDAAAADLSKVRVEAAASLDAAVMAELAPLKLDRAQFRTTVEPDGPGPDGADRVEFRVATNPGAPAGPLARIASGGELSRFLLALKACLTGDDGRSMIFDEIDRGVGGATAAAVGARLAALAGRGQILVVTHSPQVAARAARHFRIAKRVDGDTTRTEVELLGASEREAEIARMLAGETVTDAARDAARALLGA